MGRGVLNDPVQYNLTYLHHTVMYTAKNVILTQYTLCEEHENYSSLKTREPKPVHKMIRSDIFTKKLPTHS